MPTKGGYHPAYQANTQKPDCRRFKSCPPDQKEHFEKHLFKRVGDNCSVRKFIKELLQFFMLSVAQVETYCGAK